MTVFQQQHILAALGYSPTYFDGLDGPKTQAAREFFHSDYGVEATADNLIAALAGTLHKEVSSENPQNDTQTLLWTKLKNAGLSDAGAAGVMGNVLAESNFDEKNLEDIYERKLGFNNDSYTAAVDNGSYTNFVRDAAGYGLCQWTYWTRKDALLAFARERKSSIGNAEMQVEFLLCELRTLFPGLLAVLKKTSSVQEASDAFMVQFENPADKTQAAKNVRASYGLKMYNQYASK